MMRPSKPSSLQKLRGANLDGTLARCSLLPKPHTCVFSTPMLPSQGQIQCVVTDFTTGIHAFKRVPRRRCCIHSPATNRRSVACASVNPHVSAPSGPALPGGSEAPYWRTYLSRKSSLLRSLEECLANIRSHGPVPERVDLALVYVSSAYEQDYGKLVGALRRELPGLRNVFGCTGFGIIGVDGQGAHEVEALPALSLTLAALPLAEVVVRHVDTTTLPDGDAPPDRWSSLLGVPAFPEAPLSLVVLAHPHFAAVGDLLAGLDFAFPTATKIGGLSSAASPFGGSATATFCWSASTSTPASTSTSATTPASTSLSTATSPSSTSSPASSSSSATSGTSGSGAGSGDVAAGGPGEQDPSSSGSGGVHLRGASVLALHGGVTMDLMIAQGCRPLTPTTWTVVQVAPGDPTRVLTLSAPGVAGGRALPALEAFQRELQSVLSGMDETQLRRTVANLTVGVAPPEGGLRQMDLEPQDFLIRMLRGFDTEQGLVVGERMRAGQRLRFMVRDRQGAQEDLTSHGLAYKRKQLQAMLQGGSEQPQPPFGMLMSTCNGRGSGLYGEPSYDARTMTSYVPVPVAGFQCNGEIGRVGDTTHLHGFTCAVGVLRLTSEAAAAAAAAASRGNAASGVSAVPSKPPAPQPQQQQQQRPQQEQE